MRTKYLVIVILITLSFVFYSCSKGEKVVVQKYEDGKPFIVQYFKTKNGKRTAVYQENYYPDGKLRLEGCLEGVNNRKGEWKFYYSDGATFATADFTQRPEGVWRVFFDKDSLLISKDDKLTAIAFSDEGTPVSMKIKRDNKEIFYRFFNSFKIMERIYLKGNMPQGEALSWFENGNINSLHYYKDGLQDSVYVVYAKNGNKIISGHYTKGIKTGKWEYFSSEGKPLGTEIYDIDGRILIDKKESQGLKYFTSKDNE